MWSKAKVSLVRASETPVDHRCDAPFIVPIPSSNYLSSGQNPEECDATGDDRGAIARNKK